MVRLKVQFHLFCFHIPCFVSIPYGSIKRKIHTNHRCGTFSVSIPYGSIKSYAFAGSAAGKSVVSIPYGSIKRKKITIKLIRHNVSIPYGSIKSLALRELESLYRSFNSLWFD